MWIIQVLAGQALWCLCMVSVLGDRRDGRVPGVPLSTQRDAGTISMWLLGAEQGKNSVTKQQPVLGAELRGTGSSWLEDEERHSLLHARPPKSCRLHQSHHPTAPIHPSLTLALIPAAQCCLQHRAPERGRRVTDVAVWAQNGCGLGVTVICCCLTTTNQIFKQTLNAPWPYCYLAGAGDLDKSLKLCARGFYFVPASFVSIPSQACVTQQWS